MLKSKTNSFNLITLAITAFLLVGCVEEPPAINRGSNGSGGSTGPIGSTGPTGTATMRPVSVAIQAVEGASPGNVVINPGNYTCASSCTFPIADGSSLRAVATAQAGYEFVSWSGGCTPDATNPLACNAVVNSGIMISATFKKTATTTPLSESDFNFSASVTQVGSNASISGSVTAASLHWDQWTKNQIADNRICLFIGIVANDTVFLLTPDGNWKVFVAGEADCFYQFPERIITGEAFNGPLSFFPSGSPIYVGYGRGQLAIDEMMAANRYQQIGIVP